MLLSLSMACKIMMIVRENYKTSNVYGL